MSALRDRIAMRPSRLPQAAAAFLSWWGRSLAAWLPARVRRAFGLANDRLLISVSAAPPVVYREQDGANALVPLSVDGTASSRDRARLPRWLLLPAEASLRRRMALPAAAGTRLREVVSFEIDRQTPFATADVLYDARTVERCSDGRIVAELVVVPRRTVQHGLQSIGGDADAIAGIDVADRNGAPLGVNLLPPEQRSRSGGSGRFVDTTLAVAIVVLLATVMWQALEGRRERADALQRIVDTRLGEARAAAAGHKRLLDLAAGRAFVERERAARPSTLAIIDELSRRIPDHTYVESLTMDGDELTLTGLSGDASSLVGLLDGSPLWRDAALTGSVQPDPATRRDRFTLTARITSGTAAAGSNGQTQ